MNVEELHSANLVEKYIDFGGLVVDYDLKEGGLAPEQYIALEELLIQFIKQNK